VRTHPIPCGLPPPAPDSDSSNRTPPGLLFPSQARECRARFRPLSGIRGPNIPDFCHPVGANGKCDRRSMIRPRPGPWFTFRPALGCPSVPAPADQIRWRRPPPPESERPDPWYLPKKPRGPCSVAIRAGDSSLIRSRCGGPATTTTPSRQPRDQAHSARRWKSRALRGHLGPAAISKSRAPPFGPRPIARTSLMLRPRLESFFVPWPCPRQPGERGRFWNRGPRWVPGLEIELPARPPRPRDDDKTGPSPPRQSRPPARVFGRRIFRGPPPGGRLRRNRNPIRESIGRVEPLQRAPPSRPKREARRRSCEPAGPIAAFHHGRPKQAERRSFFGPRVPPPPPPGKRQCAPGNPASLCNPRPRPKSRAPSAPRPRPPDPGSPAPSAAPRPW